MNPPFRCGKVFMHKNCKDTALQVDRIDYIGDDYVKVRVTHINLGYKGKPWIVQGPRAYKIFSNEYDNYMEITPKQLATPRKTDGLPE